MQIPSAGRQSHRVGNLANSAGREFGKSGEIVDF